MVKVIAIANQKGGAGKSTTTVNMAAELDKHFDLTVLDLDSQQHSMKFNRRRDKPFKAYKIENDQELTKILEQEDKKENSLVLIDTGGYDSSLTRVALFCSDLVIIPTNKSDFDLDTLEDYTSIIKQIQDKRDDMMWYVLANKLHHADKNTLKSIKNFIGRSNIKNLAAFENVIRANSEFENTLRSGKSICERTAGTPAINYNAFIKELITVIKG